MTLYRIRDWAKHFEKKRSHGKRTPTHVSIPNRLDGAGYAELVQCHDEGPAHFGAWIVLLEVASVCNPRGTLVRSNGQPHDTLSLSRVTKFPERVLTDALRRLVELGWVEVSEDDGTCAQLCADGLTQSAPMGQASAIVFSSSEFNSLKEGGEELATAHLVFPVLGGGTWVLTEAKVRQYEGTYPALDVRREVRQAWQWIQDHPRNVKTADGMPRFLGNWLRRSQNSARPVNGTPRRDPREALREAIRKGGENA